jgi:hypothetical protein
MSDQIALAFENDEGLIACLELLLEEKTEIPFSTPGDMNLIIPKRELEWFEIRLKAGGHKYSLVPVVNDPELAAKLRARYLRGEGVSKEFQDPEWKRAKISELRKKLYG